MTLTVLESTAQLFCSVSLFGFVWCFVMTKTGITDFEKNIMEVKYPSHNVLSEDK